MKLIFENFRNAINEEYIPSAPPIVKNVRLATPPLYAINYLFIVVSFTIYSGETMKFGFYTTSSTNHPDQTFEGEWIPCLGIGEHSGGIYKGLPWVVKIQGKLVSPNSVLASVSKEIGKKYPPDKQREIKRQRKRAMTAKSRAGRGKPGGRQAAMEELQQRQIDIVNQAFKNNDVYSKTSLVPMTPNGGLKIS